VEVIAPFRSLTRVVLARAAERGERSCMTWVRGGVAHALSGRELEEQVRALVLGLDELGLGRGERIGILSQNRWEWILLDLAATGRGLVVVSIDPVWSDNLVARILNHARVRCVFVESPGAARQLETLADRLPHLRAIISIDDDPERAPAVTTLPALVAAGRGSLSANPARVDELLDAVGPDDVATIIHTGGSTGEPKGVLRSHGNAVSNGWAFFPWRDDRVDPTGDEATVFNPLSFCHSAGRWWYQMTLAVRGILALPSSGALDLTELALLRPTRIVAVPRVILQLQKQLMPHVEEQWAALEVLAVDDPARAGLRAGLAARVRSLVGGRLQCILWGGGPLAASLIAFFQEGAGIRLLSGYGGTEIGIISMRAIESPPGTVGKPVGAEMRIEGGEILVRGPGVTSGYLDNPGATRAARAVDGWWRSGDLGRFDAAGELIIAGRVRAMFTCAEGTNIDPSELEQLLEADPYISQAILLGHNHPFLAALIVPDRARLVAAGVADGARLLAQRIDQINGGLEAFERIRAFRVIDEGFPETVREITMANKIRVDRGAVERTYADQIAAIYRK
jgi:long-chain acyl-CoA synthetase